MKTIITPQIEEHLIKAAGLSKHIGVAKEEFLKIAAYIYDETQVDIIKGVH